MCSFLPVRENGREHQSPKSLLRNILGILTKIDSRRTILVEIPNLCPLMFPKFRSRKGKQCSFFPFRENVREHQSPKS